MSAPFLPSAANALVVLDSDNLCTALLKVIKSFYLAYRYERYKRDDGGNISSAFCAEIKTCAANTPTTTTTP